MSSLFSIPRTRQVGRAAHRSLAKLFKRSGIEAGAVGRRWDGASTLTDPLNGTLAARGPAQGRAAAQYINTPWGQRIVETWVSALAGKGYQVRARHPDETTARALNDDFEALFAPILPLVVRALIRDGEAFLRIQITASGEIRLKAIPSEQVDPTINRDLGNGARIVRWH